MAGVSRLGLVVEAETLAGRWPLATHPELQAVARCLTGIDPGTLALGSLAQWGVPLQREMGRLVDEQIALDDTDAVRTAPRHLARLQVLLSELAEGLAPRRRLLPWKGAEPAALLHARAPEIEHLRRSLEAAEPTLLVAVMALVRLDERCQTVAGECLAHGRAGEWLAERLVSSPPVPGVLDPDERRSALQSRVHGLVAAEAQARQQQLLLRARRADLQRLQAVIQSTVLVALPAWLALLASFPPEWHATHQFNARDRLLALLSSLASTEPVSRWPSS